MVEVKKNASPKVLLEIANTLDQLRLDLEPVRNKALDEKARITGYAQCAEQFIGIIVTRMNDLKQQAETSSKQTRTSKSVPKLVPEVEKTKTATRRKRTAKESSPA